jgi:hypothetical protein
MKLQNVLSLDSEQFKWWATKTHTDHPVLAEYTDEEIAGEIAHRLIKRMRIGGADAARMVCSWLASMTD